MRTDFPEYDIQCITHPRWKLQTPVNQLWLNRFRVRVKSLLWDFPVGRYRKSMSYFQWIFACKYNQWIIRFYCIPGKTPALNHFWLHIRSLNGMKHPVPFTPGLMFPKFWLRLKLYILCCIQKLKMCFYSGYDFTSVENKYITVSRIWCFLQRQRTNPSSTCYRTAFSVPSQEAKCILKTYKITCLHFISVLPFSRIKLFPVLFFKKKKVQSFTAF